MHLPTSLVVRISAGLLSASAFLITTTPAYAQQPSPKQDTTATSIPLTPAERAACNQVVGYAFGNPPVMQRFQQLQAGGQAKTLQMLPDSSRGRIAKALAKGQGDSLKAVALRQLGPQIGPTFDSLIDFVITFPDSIRQAIGTLVESGRSITCIS